LIRDLLLALGFLTRIPTGLGTCTPAEIGKSARWFPLVGAVLGALYAAVAHLLRALFPPPVVASILAALDVALTGALHYDGLADTADGFVGGRSREHILRIMRDPAIGVYGACAIAIAFSLKFAAMSTLICEPRGGAALLLAPVLGRWSAVYSAASSVYARAQPEDGKKSVGTPAVYIGRPELVIASLVAVPFAAPLWRWYGLSALLLTPCLASAWTWLCSRRIGGFTGDTLGAGVQLIECFVLVLFTAS
jgi:cobalamin 5'-phosphate synthase/cobalamin synthase